MKPNPKLASHLASKLNLPRWWFSYFVKKQTMEHESLFGRSKKVLQFTTSLIMSLFSLFNMFCGRLRIFDSKAPFLKSTPAPKNYPNWELSYHSNWTGDLKSVSSQTTSGILSIKVKHFFSQEPTRSRQQIVKKWLSFIVYTFSNAFIQKPTHRKPSLAMDCVIKIHTKML